MSAASQEVWALVALGRNADAAARAAELLAADPDDASLNVAAAFAASAVGDHDSAGRAIASAMRLDPDVASTHRIASVVAKNRGDTRQALDHARRSVQLDPLDPVNHIRLAWAELAVNPSRLGGFVPQRHLSLAADAAYEAVRLDPEQANAHAAVGGVEIARRNHPRAIAALRRAVEIEPEVASHHQNLALALERAGDRRGASEHLVAAGRADPTSSAPITSLRRLGTATKVSGAGVVTVILLQVINALRGTDDTTTQPVDTLGGPSTTVSILLLVLAALVAIALLAWVILGSRRRQQRQVMRSDLSPEAKAILQLDDASRPRGRKRRR
ncbi:MAG: hypothetical protein U0Q22_16945 [Acidimicrobiales bacterium]